MEKKGKEGRGESIESETRSLDAIGSCEPTTLDSLFHPLSLCLLTSVYLAFFLFFFYPFCCVLVCVRRISSQLDFSVNAAGESSDF